MKIREQRAAFASFVAAMIVGLDKRLSTRRQRRPRTPPPAACPAHGQAATRSRYSKAWYPCGCRYKHAHLIIPKGGA